MPERVVHVVEALERRLIVGEVSDEPELLQPADAGEVPDERRHDRRDLRDQLFVVDRFNKSQRRLARTRQRRDKLPLRRRLPRLAYSGCHDKSGEGGIRVVPRMPSRTNATSST
jgi:hypothetical protein